MAIKDDTVVGEGVDVGRRDLVAAVEGHVVPAHVVSDDHDDVGKIRGVGPVVVVGGGRGCG